jgi:1-acyl-sn-glycerol-3-phosphate acyltransferase
MLEPVSETVHIQNRKDEKRAGGLRHLLSCLRSYFFFDPLIWLYTVVFGVPSLVCSLFDRAGTVQHGFARLWARLILVTIGVPVDVIGLEKIDTSKPHIYAVNHLSAIDVPVLYGCLPFPFRILAKIELFRYPVLGWHLRRSGQIPVDQENVRRSARSLGQAAAAVKQGMPVLIFPEGGRSDDGQLKPFMNGAFYVAIKAQVDIVPMALVGTFEVLRMNSFHIMPRRVLILVGDAIPTAGLTLRDLDALSNKAQQSIAKLYYSRADVPDLRKKQ